MAHRLAAYGIEQRCRVRFVVRTGIDDRHPAPTDDVTHRAGEGERAGVIAENPPHAWNDFVDHAGLERKITIERYVVALGHRVLTCIYIVMHGLCRAFTSLCQPTQGWPRR